jgi:hypothetical protein
VLAFAQPRPETIEMRGVTLPPSMGMATSINFQSAGPGQVAATGDFVMIADEVNKVARDLRQADIAITALHNHLLASTPELYFMHFWAQGDPVAVATGLKTALGELRKERVTGLGGGRCGACLACTPDRRREDCHELVGLLEQRTG